MSKVIKKFRKNMGYDDFSSKTTYDKEFQQEKLENKRKTKQNRDRKNLTDLVNEESDDFYPIRRY